MLECEFIQIADATEVISANFLRRHISKRDSKSGIIEINILSDDFAQQFIR